MNKENYKILKVKGKFSFQGDKSLSHRAAIFSALAKGESLLENYLMAQDTLDTLKSMQKLGVHVEKISDKTFRVVSNGLSSLAKSFNNSSVKKIYVGNSGTAARLLLGLFSGIPNLKIHLDGDSSLQKRPMKRVTLPLSNFGANFEPSDFLPITITGKKLLPIIFQETLGSAQVKSAMLLAALTSQASVRLQEEIPSRDHSENMLGFAGIKISKLENEKKSIIEMEPPYNLQARHYKIWGDISSAAFFIVLGLLAKEGSLLIKDVLLNPYRDSYIKVLQHMGGKIEIHEKQKQCGERGVDIRVYASQLRGVKIDTSEIPSLIDELPILTIAAIFAEGEFSFRGASELRVKESDRIHALCSNLKNCGVEVEEFEDGLSLQGDSQKILAGEIKSFMDHRIVMSFEIAKLRSFSNATERGSVANFVIEGKEWVQTSFPDFYQKLQEATNV